MYSYRFHTLRASETAIYAAFSRRSNFELRSSSHQMSIVALRRLSALLFAMLCCVVCLVMTGCTGVVLNQAGSSSLVASSTSVNLGSVPVGNATTANVSLLNKNSAAVHVTQLSVSGQSFSVAGQTSLPASIPAGGAFNVSINFVPVVAGQATGQLSISSDASTSPTLIDLSGVGAADVPPAPQLSGLSCSSASMGGTGTDLCTVTISSPAAAPGFQVVLASNNAAVTMSPSALVQENTTSVQFAANVTPVSTAQTVTLTASAGAVTETFALHLNALVPTLSIGSSSVSFGAVAVNTSVTQTVPINSTGTAPVTIIGAAVTGAGFTLAPETFPLTLNPGQSATLSVQFDPSAQGSLAGQLSVTSNSFTNSTALIILSGSGAPKGSFSYNGSSLENTFVPPDPTTPISSNFFGMTIHHTDTPFPAFPVSTFRFWDVAAWSTVEPSSGQFDWSHMDTSVAIGKTNGISDYIFTFGSVPAWASSNPSEPCTDGDGPGTCAPPDMTAFDDFTTQVVQRYCGTIKYYETWNEPNNSSYWSGTNAQLLTVAQHLYQIAKDPANCGCTNGVCAPNGGVNPNQVLMPPISRINLTNLTWLDTYLASTGAQYPYADVAAFHGYGSDADSDTDPEGIVTQVQSLNQILAKHGLSNLQLWNTEADWGSITPVGQQQASWLMRYHAALATTGVARFVWYAYDNCSWGTLWESHWCSDPQMPTGQLTEPGQAYAVIESWLSGANLPGCQEYGNGLWACELQRPGGYEAWMLWSSTGADISVPIRGNSGLTVYRDWQNNVNILPGELTVGQMPVLLENQDL